MRERWLDTVEETARQALSVPLFRYLQQGARDGLTTAEAASAWQAARLAPHVLRDVTTVDPSTTLLGIPVAGPWAVAPTTLQHAVHPDGEVAMARDTADAGSLLVVSSNTATRFSDIGATGVHWWLQAYLPSDRTLAEPLLARAVEAGAGAIVLTVDTPTVGTKYDGPGPTVWEELDLGRLRTNFEPSFDETAPGGEKATDLGPHDIEWLASVSGLPVVVKGVLRPDDARRCVQAGARAVWVSNHGGRQLDRVLATARALSAVVAAVGGEAEVYVDGGVRSGLDVLVATALGAQGAFLGRLPLYALVGGAEGVRRMHAELASELEEAMRLAGCRTLADAQGVVAAEP